MLRTLILRPLGRDRLRTALTVVAVALGMARHAGVDAPASLVEQALPRRGWRRAAVDAVLDPTWPRRRTGHARFHLRFALSDSRWRRAGLLVGAALHEQPSWSRRVAFPARAAAQTAHRWHALRAGTHDTAVAR